MKQYENQELKDDHRKRVAVVALNESELMDNRSLFSHYSGECKLLKES